jgi:hypothetical protein
MKAAMRSKLGEHRKTLEVVSPLVAVVVLLLFGLWMRWPTVEYQGPAEQDSYSAFALPRFAYSDIASLYFRDGLWAHPRPYFDYPFEYPVGLGFLTYILNSASRTMPQYFLLTSLVMAISALLIALLVTRFPHGRLLLFALSPALALYFNLNWDMWGALLMVAGLWLFVRERDGPATAVLAAASWTKFFPILFLPFLVLDRWRRDGKRAAGRIIIIFTALSAAVNVPVLLLAPEGWAYFFAFNAQRTPSWDLWVLFDALGSGWSEWLSISRINLISALLDLLVLWGLVELFMRRRLPPGAWLLAGCAMLSWFFFINKAYSPQYDLWIVVLLAIVGAAPALAVAWSAADLLYFAAQFVWIEVYGVYTDVQEWFEYYLFLPATALHQGGLLIVMGWCVKQMLELPHHQEDTRPIDYGIAHEPENRKGHDSNASG